MELDLRHLDAILAIADEGSICSAADRLRVAQPGLTNKLHRIERELGCALFIRRRDGVEPTPVGRYVVAEARKQLAEFADLRSSVRLFANRHRLPPETIQMGSTRAHLTPRLLAAVHEAAPHHTVASYTGHRRSVVARLAAGRLDLAIIGACSTAESGLSDGIQCLELYAGPIDVSLPATHRLAANPVADLADLRHEMWIVAPEDGTGRRTDFDAAWRAAGFAPQIGLVTDDERSAFGLVAAGDAVCQLLPDVATGAGMVRTAIVGRPWWWHVTLAWRVNSPVTPAVRAIADAVIARAVPSGHRDDLG